jgi:hypothetical protein
MAAQIGSPTGRCQGCNHPKRVRIERLSQRDGSYDPQEKICFVSGCPAAASGNRARGCGARLLALRLSVAAGRFL